MREVIEVYDAAGQKLTFELGTKNVETHSKICLRPDAWRRMIEAIRQALEKSEH